MWIVPWMYWHLNGTVEAQTWRFHCSSFMCERLNQMDKYWKRTYTFKSLYTTYWLLVTDSTVCFAIQEFVCREISRGIFRFCWCLLLCFVLRVQMYDQLTWPGRVDYIYLLDICGNFVHMITFASSHYINVIKTIFLSMEIYKQWYNFMSLCISLATNN